MNVIDAYKQQIIDFFGFDERTDKALSVEADRNSCLTMLMKHPYLFHLALSIISNLIYPLLGLRRKVRINKEEFIFVSCADPVFRTKNIGLITGDLSYCLIYQPNFHLKQTINYHKFFLSQSIKAFFPTVRLQDVIKAWRQLKRFEKAVNLDKRIDGYAVMKSVLSIFLIYSNVTKGYLKDCTEFKGKWILEHQIYFFVPVIYNLRSEGKVTTMLQHGLFFKPTTDFFPLNCDKVLCCSAREKCIYMSEGVEENRVRVLGIPIQTITRPDMISSVENAETDYNLLLLLSIVTKENAPLIKEILTYIKGKYDKVLIRFRPRSRENDIHFLVEAVSDFTISDQSKTIVEDLRRSKKVITFSADAIVEVVKAGRPFLYIWLKEYLDFIEEIQCATIDNYKERVDQLMSSETITSKMQLMAEEMVGEQNVNEIKRRFVEYIRERE